MRQTNWYLLRSPLSPGRGLIWLVKLHVCEWMVHCIALQCISPAVACIHTLDASLFLVTYTTKRQVHPLSSSHARNVCVWVWILVWEWRTSADASVCCSILYPFFSLCNEENGKKKKNVCYLIQSLFWATFALARWFRFPRFLSLSLNKLSLSISLSLSLSLSLFSF